MFELYQHETWVQIFFVTGVLGGLAAFATGKAIAETWRQYLQLVAYSLLLGGAVRFAHFALFGGTLLSIASYLADMLYLLAVGSIAFRMTRARQMTTQYRWLYERTSPFTWRAKVPPRAAEKSDDAAA